MQLAAGDADGTLSLLRLPSALCEPLDAPAAARLHALLCYGGRQAACAAAAAAAGTATGTGRAQWAEPEAGGGPVQEEFTPEARARADAEAEERYGVMEREWKERLGLAPAASTRAAASGRLAGRLG